MFKKFILLALVFVVLTSLCTSKLREKTLGNIEKGKGITTYYVPATLTAKGAPETVLQSPKNGTPPPPTPPPTPAPSNPFNLNKLTVSTGDILYGPANANSIIDSNAFLNLGLAVAGSNLSNNKNNAQQAILSTENICSTPINNGIFVGS